MKGGVLAFLQDIVIVMVMFLPVLVSVVELLISMNVVSVVEMV